MSSLSVAVLEPRSFFDPFVLGVVEVDGVACAAYDQDALIEGLTMQARADCPELSEDEAYIQAQEHFDFNVQGSCTFEGAPVFVSSGAWLMVLSKED